MIIIAPPTRGQVLNIFPLAIRYLDFKKCGLDDDSDTIFNVYHAIMERRSKKIEADNDAIMKQALKAYMELKAEKKKRAVR